ncbi:hypothetical protein GN958_ATG14219 [Phytophthora infestans]|uniref:Uncharacterized protein n=1 Tax=Phytophthora infestans TaxID=4787 RepID=A0A8S9UC48_PHYIN|nr:hypothetical protein GN958_ATG14219 [Phytophthora infestans]
MPMHGWAFQVDVPVENANFDFDEEQDGFEQVYALADERVKLALANYSTKTTQSDKKLYLKSDQHAKQAQLEALTSENWHEMLTKARANYHKQKTFNGIRRATPARIVEAMEAIDSYMAERPEIRVGDIARTHWAIIQAHQLDDASVSIPESATFRQMQHLATMSTSRQEDQGADSFFVNISELRTLLELPNYSPITEGLLSHFQPPPEPLWAWKT